MDRMLSDPVWLKNIQLRNRSVLAAAASGSPADDCGVIREEEIERLTQYANNGVGLIITGAIGISATALSRANSCLLAGERDIPGISDLTKSAHQNHGKIAAHICHSGIWTGGYLKAMGREAIGPSQVPDSSYTARPGFEKIFMLHQMKKF